MFTIYKTAFGFVGRNPVFFGVIALAMLGLNMLTEYLGKGGAGMAVAWFILVYVLHRAMMFDEVDLIKKPQNPRRPIAMGRFLLASGIMFVVALAVAVIGAIVLVGDMDIVRRDPDYAFMVMAAMMGGTYLVLLSIFGTALPAAAAADRWGPAITLQRAAKTWWRIAGGLLIGPGLFMVAAMAGVAGLTAYVVGIEPYFTPTGGVDPVQVLLGYAINLAALFHTLLTVTVLSLAYQRVAPVDVREAMGHFEEKAEIFA